MKPDPKATPSSAHETERELNRDTPAAQPGESAFQFPPWEEVQERIYQLLLKMARLMCIGFPSLQSNDLAHESLFIVKSYYHSTQRRGRVRKFNGWLYAICRSALRDGRRRLLELRRPVSMMPLEIESEGTELQSRPEIDEADVLRYRTKLLESRYAQTLEQVFSKHMEERPDGEESLIDVIMFHSEEQTHQEIAEFWSRVGEKRSLRSVRYLIDTDKEALLKEFEAIGVTSLKDL